ncbi:MAG: diphosphomevalonate decarboxylase [Anaerolineales bacterium]|nr:diphosphomevalonate decarboxylase [Anaerolineales bacterium]MCB9126628.1 diphosphomevalonate decarboxylase [Ardenticatenales bacterium]MCB9172746.1 diphosphomevalonate decarboxylase [Ardenticatenales bacterium]
MNATARAGSNIAFIKYWGVADAALNLPLTNSISMTLDRLYTVTTVNFDDALDADVIVIDGAERRGDARRRAVQQLDRLRQLAKIETKAEVQSRNNFPMGAGIASSASAFAALTLAASEALGLGLDHRALSRVARRASGSASRSLFGGFVEWQAGHDDESSYAEPLFDSHHWHELRDVVAVVAHEEKKVSSADGHGLARSSPFLHARVDQAERLLPTVRKAIRARDLMELGPAIEADALAMHFVMMSSQPPLFYWSPQTLHLLKKVQLWREQGLQAYFTIDAGPNIHFICEDYQEGELIALLQRLDSVKEIFSASPGPAAMIE